MDAPAPVALPPLDYKIDLPPAIVTVIPTTLDVIAADKFRHLVTTTGADYGANPEARKAAIIYGHKVTHAVAVAEGPPVDGLHQILARIDELGERLDRRIDQLGEHLDTTDRRIDQLGERLDRRIDQLGERLDRRIDQLREEMGGRIDQLGVRIDQLGVRIKKLEGVTIKGYIRMIKRENSVYQPNKDLEEVPFPDGTFPWETEIPGSGNSRISVPELKNIDAVKTLTTVELYAYCKGYYPGVQVPRDGPRRREMILAAIGRGQDAHLLVVA